MGMMSEFREFAMRGNVIDLAVGVVIGAAFGRIVAALVDGLIMPPLGLLIGGIDLSEWVVILRESTVDAAGEEVPAVVLAIGEFLNALLQFALVALAIFLMIRLINRLHRKREAAPEAPAAPPEDVLLLREIRDQLRQR